MIVCYVTRMNHVIKVFEHFCLGDLAIIAGSDTTSTAVTVVLYHLMTNPTAYRRLQAEIDELGDNVVDCATQVHLPYLNAVLYGHFDQISGFPTKNGL